jgi:hypothetical protein
LLAFYYFDSCLVYVFEWIFLTIFFCMFQGASVTPTTQNGAPGKKSDLPDDVHLPAVSSDVHMLLGIALAMPGLSNHHLMQLSVAGS